MVAPLSVAMIVRDEAITIKKCLESLRPYVAEIVVVDTGSIDDTFEVAKTIADKCVRWTECNDEKGRIKDFSQARNYAWSLVTQPWAMWVDGDDVVEGAQHLEALLSSIEKTAPPGQSISIILPYEYSHDAKGNVLCHHYRERIVKPPHGFTWVNPVHEVLIGNPGLAKFDARTDDVKIVHMKSKINKVTESGRNLRILKDLVDRIGDSDARHLYYLGLEYGYSGDIDNALKWLIRYTEISGWEDEKFMAMVKIAEHYQNRGNYEKAIEWGLKSISVKEVWSEAYFCLARSFYHLAMNGKTDVHRNWERCVYFAEYGLSLPETKTLLFVNPEERKVDIHRYLNVALYRVGRLEDAIKNVEKTLVHVPDDSPLLSNLRLYRRDRAFNNLDRAIDDLTQTQYLPKEKGAELRQSFHEAVAFASATVEEVVETKTVEVPETTFVRADQDVIRGFLSRQDKPAERPTLRVVEHVRSPLDIIIYTGGCFEKWNPDIAARQGIGGSESMVIEMSKRLVALGNKVRVFNECEGVGGVFEGVEYIDHNRYQHNSCDVLIASRRPDACDRIHNLTRKASLCWVHDIHCGSLLTHDRAIAVDKFLCLTNWHKDFFLQAHDTVHPDQVIVTRNGIDLSLFEGDVPRNPHHAVYSSSPDRGLEVLLRVWPRIRARVPDATLDVFYGFQTWEGLAGHDAGQAQLIRHLKNMLNASAAIGVTHHGRVDHKTLAKSYMKAGVWGSPTWFTETSCRSAMEAQAAGLRIVTSPIAALNETVGSRGTMIQGDWLTEQYQNDFVEAVVNEMMKPGDSDRKALQEYARNNFGLDSLAKEWDGMLRNVLEEVRVNVMPPYQPFLK